MSDKAGVHRPERPGSDGLGYGFCVGCGELWPCMASRPESRMRVEPAPLPGKLGRYVDVRALIDGYAAACASGDWEFARLLAPVIDENLPPHERGRFT